VLLKNKAAILPLVPVRLHTIAVIGSHSDVGMISGGGSRRSTRREAMHFASGTRRDALAGRDLVPDLAVEGHPGSRTQSDGQVRLGRRSGCCCCVGQDSRCGHRLCLSVGERGHGPAQSFAGAQSGCAHRRRWPLPIRTP